MTRESVTRQSVSDSAEHEPTVTHTRGAETVTVSHPWPGIFVMLAIHDRHGDVHGWIRLTPGQAAELGQSLTNHSRRAVEMQAFARTNYPTGKE